VAVVEIYKLKDTEDAGQLVAKVRECAEHVRGGKCRIDYGAPNNIKGSWVIEEIEFNMDELPQPSTWKTTFPYFDATQSRYDTTEGKTFM
jgi:hypothetical protein